MEQDGKPAKATDSQFSVCFGTFTDSNSFCVPQAIDQNLCWRNLPEYLLVEDQVHHQEGAPWPGGSPPPCSWWMEVSR